MFPLLLADTHAGDATAGSALPSASGYADQHTSRSRSKRKSSAKQKKKAERARSVNREHYTSRHAYEREKAKRERRAREKEERTLIQRLEQEKARIIRERGGVADLSLPSSDMNPSASNAGGISADNASAPGLARVTTMRISDRPPLPVSTTATQQHARSRTSFTLPSSLPPGSDPGAAASAFKYNVDSRGNAQIDFAKLVFENRRTQWKQRATLGEGDQNFDVDLARMNEANNDLNVAPDFMRKGMQM